MITARKSNWFERVFEIYNRNLIARRFQGMRIAGLAHLKQRQPAIPMLLYANHSSWWDGLVVYHLSRFAGLDIYAMMEERQLREYPFHRKLGAFSVVRERPREALRSIEYAAALMRDTHRALWIFPQGETRPNDLRPLKLYAGAARIVERTGQMVTLPVALRYEHLDDFRPEIFVRIGVGRVVNVDNGFDAKNLTCEFEARLTKTLDELRADIVRLNLGEYEEIVAPRRRRNALKID